MMKWSSERKANMLKIKAVNESEIVSGALGFLKERFNAEVSVYSEEDRERYDSKQRAALAMPCQQAMSVENVLSNSLKSYSASKPRWVLDAF
jgi:hypothetical protein